MGRWRAGLSELLSELLSWVKSDLDCHGEQTLVVGPSLGGWRELETFCNTFGGGL
jgi:hypothetical protein